MPIPADGGGGGAVKPKKKGQSKAKVASSTSSHLDHNSQLLEAVSQGKPRVVRRLLDGKADPNFQGGPNKASPLILSCEIKDEVARETIVDMLLDKGGDVNLQDACGKTALIKAISNEIPTTSKLLKHGADVGIADGDGNVALNHAAELGNVECVQQLVREGKRRKLKLVDHQNLHGLTPLLLAAREGHLDTARILVDEGASLSKRDLEHFMTAQDWMKLSGCFSSNALQFLSPGGRRKQYHRQERIKKGIKTLADMLPTVSDGDMDSPNVFSFQQPETKHFQLPTLYADSAPEPPIKSMFDVAIKTPKKQASSSLSSAQKTRRHSISFPSEASVKTDLYTSSYLNRRKSILLKNSQSDGFHTGALAPLAPPPTTSANRREHMKNASKLPPIKFDK